METEEINSYEKDAKIKRVVADIKKEKDILKMERIQTNRAVYLSECLRDNKNIVIESKFIKECLDSFDKEVKK